MNQITTPTYRGARQIKAVALVGVGSVGKSWAALYLAHGYEVIATDPAPAFEQALRRFVTDAWPALRRLQPTAAPVPPMQLLSIAASPAEAATRADLVHENAPENPPLKVRLIAELDAAMPQECLILSSTGGIGASLLQSQCRFPGRVVIAHPFNPPHIIPLVEIIGGAATDPAAVQWTKTFLRGLGKRPIVLRREVSGHLANRLQAALLREAFHCLVEEVASAQDIDDAVRYGLGLRWALMGGLMTFHLAGGEGGAAHTLDLAAEAFERWWADLGDLHLTPQVRTRIIAGAAEIAGTRSIGEWIRWRDEHLVGLIQSTDTAEPRA
jgi:carnitine 3-dehydrogenase